MKKTLILVLVILAQSIVLSQKKEVLFIGNSYTSANNLPNLVKLVANSTNDTINIDSNTPGGSRFLNHSSNATTISKIYSKQWDYVVLQAQSQEPSWPIGQVQNEVFAHAKILCDTIRANNSCTQPIFYMTWGRENGDAGNCSGWPYVCTYEGMDSLLALRYNMMGTDNNAFVSPVGAVWKYIRQNHPGISLYSADGSHPSQEGSYLAACTFYTVILRKDPTLITYDYTLSAQNASIIKSAAKLVAFDSLTKWNVGTYDLVSDFSSNNTSGNTYQFTNNSNNATSYYWDFGDGNTSIAQDPSHTFVTNGNYTVSLIAINDCDSVTVSKTVGASTTGISEDNLENQVSIYPNPNSSKKLNIRSVSNDNLLLTIFDLNGKKLKTESISNNEKVELNELNKGIYILKLQNEKNESFIQKLIID